MGSQVRVRYAPSPTGHLHIGNARTALANYLFARNQGGTFIVRVEDTDTKRNVEYAESNQLDYLRWLGIDWDESVDKGGPFSPYRQSERLDQYKIYADQLLAQGHAYPCYCTEDELATEREGQIAAGQNPMYAGKCRHLTAEAREALQAEGRQPSLRFQVPADQTYTFEDMVKGEVSFDAKDFGDFVIVKKEGIPTYNFAVVVDDQLMEISHVLRGDDHISNTPRQMMIYEALGWQPPTFGHMTVIVNEQGKKLSKRDGNILQFIEQYSERGYLPEAMVNFMALLGWSPEGEQELFTLAELIAQFDPNRLSKSPAVFNTDKLAWMSSTYMKDADPKRVADLCIPHMQAAGYLFDDVDEPTYQWLVRLVALYQEQMSCAADLVGLTSLFFAAQLEVDEEGQAILAAPEVPEVLEAFAKQLEQLDVLEFENQSIKAALKAVQQDTGHKGKALFMPVRVAITGQTHGRDLMETIVLLGRRTVSERLRTGLDRLS